MKKVFLVLLCAGLFAACGNKNTQTEEVADTNNVNVEQVVEDQPEVAEQPAPAPATTAKKNNTPAKSNSTMKVAESDANTTVKQHAEQAASRIAKTAIDKGEKDATKKIQETPTTPTKSRR